MRNITWIFSAVILMFFTACEGPVGPPGPPGFDGVDGQDGINLLGQVIEIEGTFVDPDYSLFFEFPQTIEVFESDVVLVYILWGQTEDADGLPVDIWRLLPQTRLLDQGILQYNYDHTFFDVSIFLEFDFDPTTLLPGDTDNQIFRIAVLPADFLQGSRVNLSNLEVVMSLLNVEESDIRRVTLE
ncbi:MAG: collagen-like protein [Flavobacteriaceae bacterium]